MIKIISKDYEYGYCLTNMLSSIENASNIEKYDYEIKEQQDGTNGLFLKPYTMYGYLGTGAAFTSYDDGRGTTWKQGTRFLGWVDGDNYLHYLHWNKPDWWFFTFINRTKPCVTMEYKEGELSFAMHYARVGYHGNKYIIVPGKYAIVENYDKDRLVSSTTLDFIIDADFEGLFSFGFADESKIEKIIDENDGITFLSRREGVDPWFCSRINRTNGDTITGFSTEKGFEGTILMHGGMENNFFFKRIMFFNFYFVPIV